MSLLEIIVWIILGSFALAFIIDLANKFFIWRLNRSMRREQVRHEKQMEEVQERQRKIWEKRTGL